MKVTLDKDVAQEVYNLLERLTANQAMSPWHIKKAQECKRAMKPLLQMRVEDEPVVSTTTILEAAEPETKAPVEVAATLVESPTLETEKPPSFLGGLFNKG